MNVFRRLPIRGQMYLIAALTLGVFVVILLFNYNRSASLLTKNNEAYTNDIFSQMEQTIFSNYDVVKWLTYNIAYNKSVQDYLLDEDMLFKIQNYPTIKNLFLNLSTVKPGILDFVVIEKNGATFSLQGSDISEYGNFMPKKADSYFSKAHPCISPGGLAGYCFAVGTNIFSSNIKKQYTNEIGRIILIIDSSALTGGYDLKSLQPGTSVYLLDRSDTIFMSNDRSMIGQPFHVPNLPKKSGVVHLNGKITHIQMDELPQVGGKIVRVIPDEIFFKNIRNLRKQTLIALAIGILLLTVPFLLILNNMIVPLRKLFHKMRITDSGDLNKRIDLHGSTEAVVIGNRYNQMLSDVQDLTKQLVKSNERLLKSEIEKKLAEFDFLKSQINPHFLYNTLDSICGIASDRGVPEIREMTRALSRIFQYSIKGYDFVPLKDEIRIVESYMKIQTNRFSHRFEFLYDIPKHLMNLSVPKMILQPIVENAVYHGLEPRYKKGMLRISAHLDNSSGEDLILTVQDNGVGMDEETLQRCKALLRTDERDEHRNRSPNIGLSNVHYRLQYLYGTQYGLHIFSKENEGTVVTLRTPKMIEGGNPNV
jgi:two-component system sensor histidine kinase YesM